MYVYMMCFCARIFVVILWRCVGCESSYRGIAKEDAVVDSQGTRRAIADRTTILINTHAEQGLNILLNTYISYVYIVDRDRDTILLIVYIIRMSEREERAAFPFSLIRPSEIGKGGSIQASCDLPTGEGRQAGSIKSPHHKHHIRIDDS
jgi:hypothetical protein